MDVALGERSRDQEDRHQSRDSHEDLAKYSRSDHGSMTLENEKELDHDHGLAQTGEENGARLAAEQIGDSAERTAEGHRVVPSTQRSEVRGSTVWSSTADVLAPISQAVRARQRLVSTIRPLAGIVFEYWAEKMRGPDISKVVFDDKRAEIIMDRLVENKTDLSELLYAVDGALKVDYIMGRGLKAKVAFNGVETIFKDRAHVEKFSRAIEASRRGVPHPDLARVRQKLRYDASLPSLSEAAARAIPGPRKRQTAP